MSYEIVKGPSSSAIEVRGIRTSAGFLIPYFKPHSTATPFVDGQVRYPMKSRNMGFWNSGNGYQLTENEYDTWRAVLNFHLSGVREYSNRRTTAFRGPFRIEKGNFTPENWAQLSLDGEYEVTYPKDPYVYNERRFDMQVGKYLDFPSTAIMSTLQGKLPKLMTGTIAVGMIQAIQELEGGVPAYGEPWVFVPGLMEDPNYVMHATKRHVVASPLIVQDGEIRTAHVSLEAPYSREISDINVSGYERPDGSVREDALSTEHMMWIEPRNTALTKPKPEEPGGTFVRYDPRTGTSTVGVYHIDKKIMRELKAELSNRTLGERINEFMVGTPGEHIQKLTWFYGLRSKIVNGAQNVKNIRAGNVDVFSSDRSGGTLQRVEKDFVRFDWGMVRVSRVLDNAGDYSDCTYKAVIPFVGEVELDPQDVVDRHLYLSALINLTDGTGQIRLGYDTTEGISHEAKGTIGLWEVQWGYDIPMDIPPARIGGDALGNLAQVPLALLGGRAEAVRIEGGPNPSVLMDLQAKVITYTPTDLSKQLKQSNGLPTGNSGRVDSFQGYLEVGGLTNPDILPVRWADDIIDLLKGGIYV